MLTIKDLSTSKELDHTAMTTVSGGYAYPDFLAVISAPYFDLSQDEVFQTQVAVLDQSGNWGGVNVGTIDQRQNGNA